MVADMYLTRKEVEKITSLSRSTIYREIAKGAFPAQVKLTDGRRGWSESDVKAWCAKRATYNSFRSEKLKTLGYRPAVLSGSDTPADSVIATAMPLRFKGDAQKNISRKEALRRYERRLRRNEHRAFMVALGLATPFVFMLFYAISKIAGL